ncbi:hypothetical protein WJ438_17970 [Streptomyces sp. GD-15H]|uniref:hypothetical protein n=1 Tax=Streptomyces sp. GD-15H TaxID=3129112 RepID=UPI0032507588
MVVGDHLAQHRELSLTAIGQATYIPSVPEGPLVDIRSLAERFPEGRDRIAFAPRPPAAAATAGPARRQRARAPARPERVPPGSGSTRAAA